MAEGILLESGTNELELLEFTINGNYYGINVAKVKEILPYTKPTLIPNAHRCIEGVFMPRDSIITAVDLARVLNMPPSGKEMYDILKNVIAAGGVKLADIQHRIKKLYSLGDLTGEQLDELLLLTQQNADPEAERPETLEMIRKLTERVVALERMLADKDDTAEEQQGYEEWTQPVAGLTDKYQHGAIVGHNGSLWRSDFAGQNVWEPGAVGTEALWVKYEEETV